FSAEVTRLPRCIRVGPREFPHARFELADCRQLGEIRIQNQLVTARLQCPKQHDLFINVGGVEDEPVKVQLSSSMQRFKPAMARMSDAKETTNDRGLGVKN